MLQLGFYCSKSDASLFVYRTHDITVIILVYVDDVLLTGNDDDFVQSLIEKLGQEFAIKDLGSLHYFLGVEVKPFLMVCSYLNKSTRMTCYSKHRC